MAPAGGPVGAERERGTSAVQSASQGNQDHVAVLQRGKCSISLAVSCGAALVQADAKATERATRNRLRKGLVAVLTQATYHTEQQDVDRARPARHMLLGTHACTSNTMQRGGWQPAMVKALHAFRSPFDCALRASQQLQQQVHLGLAQRRRQRRVAAAGRATRRG